MSNKIFVFFVCCNLFHFLIANINLDCLKGENCSSCIQISNCAWCLDSKFKSSTGKKCDLYENLIKDGCSKNFIYNPLNTVSYEDNLDDNLVLELKNLKDYSINDKNFNKVLSRSNRNQLKNNEKNEKLVQLKPDKIKLKVRPNSKISFNLTFEQAEKYPLDIYYLMDLTWSMKDHRDALIKLASEITESMSNITTKFRLGFGSFIDKVVMPYSNMLPQKLKNPCKENIPCVPAYGFRNHLSLTNDTKLFLDKVQEAKLSGNLDNAEGGFDAIMQVISCKNKVKWNPLSRKIILFATDSIFHYAGDGKLGGIVKPNDGQCHLDLNGYYTESINQDYPTLEQINKAIVSNQINIIFSVPKSAFKVYETLSENLQGSVTGELAENSSNIVHLIRENYKKIVSTIELKDNSSKNVKINYFTKCTSKQEKSKKTNFCPDVGVGEKLQFEVELEVKSCSSFKNKIENFVIFPIGIEEKTEIELEIICDCECEKNVDHNSKICHGNGHLKCGICDCEASNYGDKCECSQLNLNSSITNSKCIFNEKTCNGKGTCVCDECVCNNKENSDLLIYGKFCECDNYSCPKNDLGVVCSGKGRCCNKKCECSPGWSGESCDCSLDESTCFSPINNKICSGNGICECGKCICKRTNSNEIWTGRYCNECPTCGDECAAHDACVLCKGFNTGPFKNNCNQNCNFEMKVVKEFNHFNNDSNIVKNELEEKTGSFLKRCIMVDEDNCKYEFVYIFQPIINRISIEILKSKSCPNSQNIYFFMLFIVSFIILSGILALIIWRAVVSYQDRKACKEWMKYLKKRELTFSGENPIYKAPNTEYKNPLYKSKIDN